MKSAPVEIALTKKAEKIVKETGERLDFTNYHLKEISNALTKEKEEADVELQNNYFAEMLNLEYFKFLSQVHLTAKQMETVTIFANRFADVLVKAMKEDNEEFRYKHPVAYQTFMDRHLKEIQEGNKTIYHMSGPLGTVVIDEE